jgi:hypothetical protein
MPTLYVDIQEGFKNDTVTIDVNGKQIYQKSNLTTSPISGPIDTFNIEIKQEPTIIEVTIPTKKIQNKTTLTPKSDTYLGISITENQNGTPTIRVLIQQEHFGYL